MSSLQMQVCCQEGKKIVLDKTVFDFTKNAFSRKFKDKDLDDFIETVNNEIAVIARASYDFSDQGETSSSIQMETPSATETETSSTTETDTEDRMRPTYDGRRQPGRQPPHSYPPLPRQSFNRSSLIPEGQYKCPFCGLQCITCLDYTTHILDGHQDRRATKSMRCQIGNCKYRTVKAALMLQHQHRVHPNANSGVGDRRVIVGRRQRDHQSSPIDLTENRNHEDRSRENRQREKLLVTIKKHDREDKGPRADNGKAAREKEDKWDRRVRDKMADRKKGEQVKEKSSGERNKGKDKDEPGKDKSSTERNKGKDKDEPAKDKSSTERNKGKDKDEPKASKKKDESKTDKEKTRKVKDKENSQEETRNVERKKSNKFDKEKNDGEGRKSGSKEKGSSLEQEKRNKEVNNKSGSKEKGSSMDQEKRSKDENKSESREEKKCKAGGKKENKEPGADGKRKEEKGSQERRSKDELRGTNLDTSKSDKDAEKGEKVVIHGKLDITKSNKGKEQKDDEIIEMEEVVEKEIEASKSQNNKKVVVVEIHPVPADRLSLCPSETSVRSTSVRSDQASNSSSSSTTSRSTGSRTNSSSSSQSSDLPLPLDLSFKKAPSRSLTSSSSTSSSASPINISSDGGSSDEDEPKGDPTKKKKEVTEVAKKEEKDKVGGITEETRATENEKNKGMSKAEAKPESPIKTVTGGATEKEERKKDTLKRSNEETHKGEPLVKKKKTEDVEVLEVKLSAEEGEEEDDLMEPDEKSQQKPETQNKQTQTTLVKKQMDGLFGTTTDGPGTLSEVVNAMGLEPMSEAGRKVEESRLAAIEMCDTDLIRMYHVGRLPGGAIWRKIVETVKEPTGKKYQVSICEIDDTHLAQKKQEE